LPLHRLVTSNDRVAADVPGGRVVGPVESRTVPARPEEAVITTPLKPASWTYSEEFVAEDEVLANARARAEEVGVVPIGPGGGAALRFLASVLDARAVVEVGTGTGVSGLWMLRGMRSDGVLTTVDKVADPAQRDASTVAIRELGKAVRADENLVPVLLPVGDGLLVARKVWTPEA
jgi:predicted O-methyltransferase YrrM